MIDKVIAKLAPKYQTSDTENLIKDILEASLTRPETRTVHQDQIEVYYITNPELDYYIKLNRTSITISNHTYTFREGLSDQFSRILYRAMELHIDSLVKSFEEDVFKNKTNLLNRIKSQLKIEKIFS